MERRTRQREAIQDAFNSTGRPLTPPEVLEEARAGVPGLGIATVYRAIKDLVDEGWLKPVDIPGKQPCYERRNLPHHHHFHCRMCDRVFDFERCLGALTELAPKGFLVEEHELTLIGVCPDCRAKTGGGTAGAGRGAPDSH